MARLEEDNAYVHRLLVIALLAGCRGGAKDSCESVAATVQTLAHAELAAAKVDEGTRRAVADQIPAMRDALVGVCRDGKWSAQVRACMVAAMDHAALQACESGLTDDQRRAIDKASSGDPVDDNR